MPDDAASPLPFVPPGAMLTASGRQALSLVAQELRTRGITELLAPAYHCLTMVEPFQLEGVHVELVAVGEDLLLDSGALRDALARGGRPCAVLHFEAAGNLAGPDLAAALAEARGAGHLVIVDETHSFLGRAVGVTRDDVDFRVASLRKWLPIPDGAWVTGVPPRPLPRRAIDDAVTAAGLPALATEAGGEGAGELWAWAEELVDQALQPAAMSAQAEAILAALDPVVCVPRGAAKLRAHLDRAHLDRAHLHRAGNPV